MSKELVAVLTKELGLGKGLSQDIADNCTEEQLTAVTEYLQHISQSPHKHRIDNFDKYAVMMMTAFKTAGKPSNDRKKYYHVPETKTVPKASQSVKQASIDAIRGFLNG